MKTHRARVGASRLRQRVTLQEPILAPDNYGGVTKTWQDVANLWAEVLPLSGREILFAEQLQDTITHRVRIRYRSGMKATMRLLLGSRIFNIRAVMNPEERNAVLELMVEEEGS